MAVAEPVQIVTRRPRVLGFRKCARKEPFYAAESHPLEVGFSQPHGPLVGSNVPAAGSSVSLSSPPSLPSLLSTSFGSEAGSICMGCDSDVESSYNESLVSLALTEHSFMSTSMLLPNSLFKLNSLRQSTTSALVFTTLATATAKTTKPAMRLTPSKLLKLFQQKKSPQADCLPELRRKLLTLAAASSPSSPEPFFNSSKLLLRRLYGENNNDSETPTFSARKSLLALFMNYTMLGLVALNVSSHGLSKMSLRGGDATLYPENVLLRVNSDLHTHSNECHPLNEEELVTFSEINCASSTDSLRQGGRARNREFRINCDFLKRYAIDYSARVNFLLPLAPEDVDIMVHKGNLNRFDAQYGLTRISELSKEKLWNSVVLQPRSDAFPGLAIDSERFVFDADPERRNRAVAVKNGGVIPWATHQSRLRPAGALRGTRSLGSTCSPTLGKTVTQYTIKGWRNERWNDISAEC